MSIALRDLTPAERVDVQQRFEALVSKRFAPSTKRPRFEVWWPKAPLDARAFPEGIYPPENEDGFNEAARLIGFLNSASGGEFYVANLSAPKPHFRHSGKLDEELVRWIRTRLVSNPTALLAANADLLLVTDAQMRYSVLGGTPQIIDQFERRFGGPERMQQTFADYVAQLRVGSGIDDAKWAEDFLQKWSGWV